MKNKNFKVGIIGLGYVGLPLAISFGKKFETIGFDINKQRVEDLKKKIDKNQEINKSEFLLSKKLTFTYKERHFKNCNIFIVTVPTPINKNNYPDLTYLKKASVLVGKKLKKKDIVIYESTVYPGATEEVCVPILQNHSKLKYNEDFYCGYSPERINPGDKKNKFENIAKVISGSNDETVRKVKYIYSKVIKNRLFVAKNIKTAEAAKIIENTQRDLNISLVNECLKIFNKMNVNIYDVLEAAGTKWNFLNFKPGLVGGHCIGVDPYYLTYKAKKIGFNSKVILAGRKTNDSMPKYFFSKIKTKLKKHNINIRTAKILFLGGTFKENVADIRNSKTLEMAELFSKNAKIVDIYDKFIKYNKIKNKKFNLIKKVKNNNYDCVILSVPHSYFKDFGLQKILKLNKKKSVFIDLKNTFKQSYLLI